jgi:hypothetical protein
MAAGFFARFFWGKACRQALPYQQSLQVLLREIYIDVFLNERLQILQVFITCCDIVSDYPFALCGGSCALWHCHMN